MSVYSGFATRQYETFYDQLTVKLIELLTEKILNMYNGRKLLYQALYFINLDLQDERLFAKKTVKLHKTMLKLEQNKYLQPFMSQPLDSLSNYLRQNFSASNSTAMSSMSFLDVRSRSPRKANSQISAENIKSNSQVLMKNSIKMRNSIESPNKSQLITLQQQYKQPLIQSRNASGLRQNENNSILYQSNSSTNGLELNDPHEAYNSFTNANSSISQNNKIPQTSQQNGLNNIMRSYNKNPSNHMSNKLSSESYRMKDNQSQHEQTQILEMENEEEEIEENKIDLIQENLQSKSVSQKLQSDYDQSRNQTNKSKRGTASDSSTSNRQKYYRNQIPINNNPQANNFEKTQNISMHEKSADILIQYKKHDLIGNERIFNSERKSVMNNIHNRNYEDRGNNLLNVNLKQKLQKFTERELSNTAVINRNQNSLMPKRYIQSKSEMKNYTTKLSLPKRLAQISNKNKNMLNNSNIIFTDKYLMNETKPSLVGSREDLIFLPQSSNKLFLKDELSKSGKLYQTTSSTTRQIYNPQSKPSNIVIIKNQSDSEPFLPLEQQNSTQSLVEHTQSTNSEQDQNNMIQEDISNVQVLISSNELGKTQSLQITDQNYHSRNHQILHNSSAQTQSYRSSIHNQQSKVHPQNMHSNIIQSQKNATNSYNSMPLTKKLQGNNNNTSSSGGTNRQGRNKSTLLQHTYSVNNNNINNGFAAQPLQTNVNNHKTTMVAYHNPGMKRKILMMNEDELEDIQLNQRRKSSMQNNAQQ
eukprot:403338465